MNDIKKSRGDAQEQRFKTVGMDQFLVQYLNGAMTFRTKTFRTETFRTIILATIGTTDIRDSYDIQDSGRSGPYLINLVRHHALGLFGPSKIAHLVLKIQPF